MIIRFVRNVFFYASAVLVGASFARPENVWMLPLGLCFMVLWLLIDLHELEIKYNQKHSDEASDQ